MEEKKFDGILSNLPYVPAPQNINVPICGGCVENGFEIVDRIIKRYDKYLSKGGYAYMVLECIGSDTQPYIIEYINNDFPLTINRIDIDIDNISLNEKYRVNERVKFDKIKLYYTKIMVDNESFLDINEKIFDNIKKNDSIRMILTDVKPEEYNEYIMIFSILNGNIILTFEGE